MTRPTSLATRRPFAVVARLVAAARDHEMSSSYGRIAETFELRGRVRRCAQLLDVRGIDVLNVGCSIGWFERYVIEHRGRSATGVDVSEDALAVAREWTPAAQFVRASALDLPFRDQTFDAVTMFDVIEHLPSATEERALYEAWRVLRKGGQLALSTPKRHWFSTYTDPAFYLGHRHYHLEEIAKMLIRVGFVIDENSSGGRTFAQADLLLYYMFRHLFRRERHPFSFVRRLADREWETSDGHNTLFVVATKNAD